MTRYFETFAVGILLADLLFVALALGCNHKKPETPVPPAPEIHVPADCIDDVNCGHDTRCKKAVMKFHCYKVVQP